MEEFKKCKSLCKNAVCVFDFTLSATMEYTEVKTQLRKCCKKWKFQQEVGEITGYNHFQGRVSLGQKTRTPPLIFEGIRWSVTSTENSTNDFYVIKSETRIAGPWSDTDPEDIYIPRQIREISSLFPWQNEMIKLSKPFDTRNVNVICDTDGNIGKTTIKGYMRVHGLGTPIPFCNDFKDIMRMVMDMPTATTYIMDMPRAINKEKLFQLYAGIESIKDGYAYDDRYQFKDKYFDCPNIWIFTNSLPDFTLLSKDRWIIWKVDEAKQLIRYMIDI